MYLETTLEKWLLSESVSKRRVEQIKKQIKKNNLKPIDYCMMQDGLLGFRWKECIKEVHYNREQLKIDDDGPTLSIIITKSGEKKRKYALPPGYNGKLFGEWLNAYREIIDYWVDCVWVRG